MTIAVGPSSQLNVLKSSQLAAMNITVGASSQLSVMN